MQSMVLARALSSSSADIRSDIAYSVARYSLQNLNTLEIDDDFIGILWRWSAIYAAALGNRAER